MVAATHGLVYDDIRHLSRLRMTVDVGRVELLSATTPTPLSAIIVSRALVTVRGAGRFGRPRPASRSAMRSPSSCWSAAAGSLAASWRS